MFSPKGSTEEWTVERTKSLTPTVHSSPLSPPLTPSGLDRVTPHMSTGATVTEGILGGTRGWRRVERNSGK